MKSSSFFASRFWIFMLAVMAIQGTLEISEAQGPGHLSSARGKRWFDKHEEPRAAGLLSRRFETRKATRKALRDQAITDATRASANVEEARVEEATVEQADPTASSEERSTRRRAKPAAAPLDADKTSVKVIKRSVGQRGAGSMPLKRRRTLLRPLFGD